MTFNTRNLHESDDWDDDDDSSEFESDEADDTLDYWPCPECGAQVWEEAPSCPRCGHYFTPGNRRAVWGTKPRWLRWTGWLLLGLAVGSWFLWEFRFLWETPSDPQP